MVDTHSFDHHPFSSMKERAIAASPAAPISVMPRTDLPSKAFTDEIAVSLKTGILQKQEPAQGKPLALMHRHPRYDAGRWASTSVEAGFGDLFSYDRSASLYGHNGTGWEEPPCGYLKVHFTF
jgi:hypothetical protein